MVMVDFIKHEEIRLKAIEVLEYIEKEIETLEKINSPLEMVGAEIMEGLATIELMIERRKGNERTSITGLEAPEKRVRDCMPDGKPCNENRAEKEGQELRD